MKRKADKEKTGFIERFCSAQEHKARISLIVAAAVVVTTFGTVCAASLRINSGASVPSDNMELNAAENYLAQAAIQAGASEDIQFIDGSEFIADETTETSTRNTKRGGLTGEHIVDLSDLQSLSDSELVDAILAGKAGVIDRSQIITDQSQDSAPVHSGTVGNGGGSENITSPDPVAENVPTPTLAPITTVTYELGIDVSGWNGRINWNRVKEAGISYAFIRIGGRGYGQAGNTYEDSMFSTNLWGAKNAGVKVGVYFFSQATNAYEGLEEASLTLAKLGGVSLDLPVIMDWETEYDGQHRTQYTSGEDLYNAILAFCSTIAQNGYTPGVYLDGGNINRLGSLFWDVISRYKFWYAYPYSVYNPYSSKYEKNMYETGDTVPPRDYWYEYWQYSWWGRVPGIDGDVDLDLRILGKTTLTAPEINLPSSQMTSEAGQEFNPLNGVTATTSQGNTDTSNLSYVIKNSSGQEVSLETARNTVGTYSIRYSYKDAFRGTVTADATWTVNVASTPEPSPSASDTSETDPTGSTDPTGGGSDPSESTDPTGGSDPSTENPPTESSADPSANPDNGSGQEGGTTTQP